MIDLFDKGRVVLLMVGLVYLVPSCHLPRLIVHSDPLTGIEHNNLGVALEERGELETARREYARAMEKSPQWAVPVFNAGNVEYKMGRLNEARDLYLRALEIDPNNPEIMNNLAWLLFKQGKVTEARIWIEKALKFSQRKEILDTAEQIRQASDRN